MRLPALEPHVRPRSGLGEAGARLHRERCTIAYLGASVTVQREGYRPRLHVRLTSSTGRPHRSVLAGTGAMGSISGVVLMDELVLRHRPEICFIEYTTSDAVGRTPLPHLGAVLESMVGKLRDAGCEPCFLHLFRSDGAVAPSQLVYSVYERVAAHHAVPSIDIAGWLRELVGSGEACDGDLVREDVHTTELGAELTADGIARGLELVTATTQATPRAASRLFTETFRGTKVVRVTPEHAAEPAGAVAGAFRTFYPFLELDSANELRCRLDGELLGLLVVIGRESGFIEVEAAGDVREYAVWDDACFYDRLSTVIFTPFCPAGEPVRIRLTEREVDYSVCRRPVDNAHAIEKRLKVIGFMVRE